MILSERITWDIMWFGAKQLKKSVHTHHFPSYYTMVMIGSYYGRLSSAYTCVSCDFLLLCPFNWLGLMEAFEAFEIFRYLLCTFLLLVFAFEFVVLHILWALAFSSLISVSLGVSLILWYFKMEFSTRLGALFTIFIWFIHTYIQIICKLIKNVPFHIL